MTRRDLTGLLATLAGTAAGQAFFPRWLQAAEAAEMHGHSHAPADPHDWASYRPQFFHPDEYRAIAAFAQTLIPTDDTPGAREAHVPEFLDFVVNAAAEDAPEMQKEWRGFAGHLVSGRFADLTPAEQSATVRRMEDGKPNAPDEDAPEEEGGRDEGGLRKDDLRQSYREVKRLVVFAYYTSRVGLIENLQYQGLAYLTAFPACEHPEHKVV